MRLSVFKSVLPSAMAIALAGCEPQPVVVNPDDDAGTTVIEQQGEVERDDTAAPPTSGTKVNVDVGGEGVDVNVKRDAPPQPAATQPSQNSQ
jgi:hypothetical protein